MQMTFKSLKFVDVKRRKIHHFYAKANELIRSLSHQTSSSSLPQRSHKKYNEYCNCSISYILSSVEFFRVKAEPEVIIHHFFLPQQQILHFIFFPGPRVTTTLQISE